MAAEILLSKRVQEMVIQGEEPHGPFICRVDDQDLDEDSGTDSEIPVIDLSCLLEGTEEGAGELERLKSALSSWGCFQAVGHGISFLDEVLKVGREFFEQPMEEKNKYANTLRDFQGYGGDPAPEEGQSLNWSDRIYLEVYPEDQRNYKFWPKKPASFRDVLEQYMEKKQKVMETISKAMAKSLNLSENCFLNQFGERASVCARFNYYLPSTRPDLVLGLKSHSDNSGYSTILHDRAGLQVLKDDKWITVPKNPGAILILMGDQMEIMSNGIFKSVVHRVLTSSERDRVSVAVFYTPDKEREIGPEEGLIGPETPQLYKRMTNYADLHWGYYQRGMRAIHLTKV